MRIFNTYGPRMHPYDGRVVSNFIVQALAGEDITIYGDGSADALVLLRGRPGRRPHSADEHERGFVGPVNLGNPDEFTIRELAELVIELTGSKSKMVYAVARRRSPHDDAPTSPWRRKSSTGSRRSRCERDWAKRSTGSKPLTSPNIGPPTPNF